jgi:hypothetical protein
MKKAPEAALAIVNIGLFGGVREDLTLEILMLETILTRSQ